MTKKETSVTEVSYSRYELLTRVYNLHFSSHWKKLAKAFDVEYLSRRDAKKYIEYVVKHGSYPNATKNLDIELLVLRLGGELIIRWTDEVEAESSDTTEQDTVQPGCSSNENISKTVLNYITAAKMNLDIAVANLSNTVDSDEKESETIAELQQELKACREEMTRLSEVNKALATTNYWLTVDAANKAREEQSPAVDDEDNIFD